MKRLRSIAIAFVAGVLFLFGLGFALPSTAHVERSIIINTEPTAIYTLISDFEAWEQWSPWAGIDPDAQFTITGSGMGQTMVWDSENPQVGHGRQEIIELERDRHLKTHLEFEGQGVADAVFDLTPTVNDVDGTIANATTVVWSLDSNLSEDVPVLLKPVNNYLGLLLDAMIGKDYETGLAKLKSIAER